MSFIQLAQQAQKELDGEKARLNQFESDLQSKSSSVANQIATNLVKTGELNAKEKQLQAREEDVSRRELTMRREVEVQKDIEKAVSIQKQAAEDRKKAQDYYEDARMNLESLEKRELALSEREKTYKQEIELEVMRNFTFRK